MTESEQENPTTEMRCYECSAKCDATNSLFYKGILFCSKECIELYKSMEDFHTEALIPVSDVIDVRRRKKEK